MTMFIVSMKGCLRRFACGVMFAAFVSLIVPGTSVADPIVDGPIAREKLKRDVQDLLYQQRFSELESLAKRLRTTKVRFHEGQWQLMHFYGALDEPPKGPFVQPIPKWKWDRHFALLGKWQTAYPRSVTVRVVTAAAWMAYGWDARGGGFSPTVSEEGWKLLRERTRQAVAQIETPPLKPEDDCPERFNMLLVIGKAEGWPREKFMALFNAAIAFEPHYYAFYSSAADYLTVRWHGEANEWLAFIEKIDALSGAPDSRILYARIAAGFRDQEWSKFDDRGISWSKFKQGYREMEKKFPDSPYNLNNFAFFACLAGDMAVAGDLLRQIDNAPYLKSWESPFPLYDECRKTAGVGGALRKELTTSQEKIQTRILANQGDKYAQFWESQEYPQDWRKNEQNSLNGMALLKASAEQGYAEAQAVLGIRYWNSSKDGAEREIAIGWMERAALQDNDVRYTLPRMYEEGGGARNLIKAYAWYSYNDDEDGRASIERLAKVLTPEQLAEAKKEAVRIRIAIQEVS